MDLSQDRLALDIGGQSDTSMNQKVVDTAMNSISDNLQSIVDQVSPILRNYTDEYVCESPVPGEWSKKQILGHLIDSAANNNQRFVRTLIDTPLFIPAYEQDLWVSLQGYQEHDWQLMINLWSAYNKHIAFFIGCIPEDQMTRECIVGNKPAVTLGWLIEDYVRHLKHHLQQIVEEPELKILT